MKREKWRNGMANNLILPRKENLEAFLDALHFLNVVIKKLQINREEQVTLQ
jgi:hypothetical protein